MGEDPTESDRSNGVPEILRNVPQLSRPIGLPESAKVSAVAFQLLVRHWDAISGLVKSDGDA